MARPISKEAILDAAEAIVCEEGAARMTLDGVAERAQVSKGGLMYSFPTKAALLQGMIGRLIENTEKMRERIREEHAGAPLSELEIEIRLLEAMDEQESRPAAALLAAVANQPDLMEPFRDELRKRCTERLQTGGEADRSVILYLAALGLHLSGLLNIPLYEAERRKLIFERLRRLAADPTEQI